MGGILFWITGVEGALIWAIVMTFVAMIPALGSFLVWLPIGLIMLALGNFWQGLTILIVGAVLISNIDNLLRPMLVGRDTQMHPLLILFSTLGGLIIFGISGFVMIAESHISVHTFPDQDYVFIDIFSCRPFDTDAAIDYLVKTQHPIKEVVEKVKSYLIHH